ncbi:hypothetical protein PInf_016649 [Phytophthora infestans]|nr:hypothetical protein PInf_016649 [Phytophthora infestans]
MAPRSAQGLSLSPHVAPGVQHLSLLDSDGYLRKEADKLNVDAILGVDALGAFGTLIDVAEMILTLKNTGEVLQLGMAVVHDAYMATMALSVRLPFRGQALVVPNVVGGVRDNDVALVEGTVELPPTLGIARSLCTVGEGTVIVEVCIASTNEFWIQKGTVVVYASIMPKSAFDYKVPPGEEEPQGKSVPTEGVERPVTMSITEEQGEKVCN